MLVALTFASLGDIIAVCQIAVQLGRALGDASGSAREYQELRKDLDTFVQVLMHVSSICATQLTPLQRENY